MKLNLANPSNQENVDDSFMNPAVVFKVGKSIKNRNKVSQVEKEFLRQFLDAQNAQSTPDSPLKIITSRRRLQ